MTAGDRGLRQWQLEALAAFHAATGPDFLVTATPGAGKTTLALAAAQDLIARRTVDRVIVVAPTDHLRTQWALAAHDLGLRLDPDLPNSVGPLRAGTHGCAVTYAQVAAAPMLHRARTEARRTLVVLDEIHHAGDGLTWGDAVSEAFAPARRRLALTGTPFRTRPDERIPFVRYEPDDRIDAEPGALRSVADYAYGYRSALRDGVVRPVIFAAYSGVSRWRTSAGDVVAMGLSESGTRSAEAAAWRTALSPRGRWLPHVLAAAHDRLTAVRAAGVADAAGMVLAGDQDGARAYADLLRRTTGEDPVLVLSDDPDASERISAFRDGTQRWLVAVRMVSEGVDVPRLAVGVYATSARTPLFFAQAVGRFVRARRPGETATVFLPAVRPLLTLAAEVETDRDHVLGPPPGATGDDAALDEVREARERAGASEFEALDAQAMFAHVVFAGAAHTGDDAGLPAGGGGDRGPVDPSSGSPGPGGGRTDEDADWLGIPGLLTPEQTATLLRARDEQARRTASAAAGRRSELDVPAPRHRPDRPAHEESRALRRHIQSAVAQLCGRTGRPHASVHAELRRRVPGPPSASAGVDVLQARLDVLEEMLA